MRVESRRHSWIIVAGAISGILLLLLVLVMIAWYMLQGYGVDVHFH
jgi:hypothetical protein